jgi:hypothetical protein
VWGTLYGPVCVFKDVIKFSLLQKGQNDRIKNIVSVFYGIQCYLNNIELSVIIMTNSSPDHNTSEDYVNLDSELGIRW